MFERFLATCVALGLGLICVVMPSSEACADNKTETLSGTLSSDQVSQEDKPEVQSPEKSEIKASKRQENAFKTAGVLSVLFLAIVGFLALVVRNKFGLGKAVKEAPILSAIAKVHLGNQVYANLLQVEGEQFLVVVGTKNAPGISVIKTASQIVSLPQQTSQAQLYRHESEKLSELPSEKPTYTRGIEHAG